MIERTFQHISGVGAKRELSVWRAGVADWRAFLAHGEERLPRGLYRLGRPVVERSLACLGSPDGLARLAELVPGQEHWRFWPRFSRVVYLDIETGGDLDDWGGVTVVGLYDGEKVTQYVAGRDLHELDQAMRDFEVVVTFAGSTFDLPVLRQVFPNLAVPPVHIDLRWLLKRIGHQGGLKRIERALGIGRPEEVDGMDGWGAVLLWRAHQAGDPGALARLLTYNACDIVNLEPLLRLAVDEMTARTLGRLG